MDGLVPRPPDGMCPGRLGVVILGRVIIGDIAGTLAERVRRLREWIAPSGQCP
jgi:hypothetical protein